MFRILKYIIHSRGFGLLGNKLRIKNHCRLTEKWTDVVVTWSLLKLLIRAKNGEAFPKLMLIDYETCIRTD